ncbi:chemotaxis protein CheD [Methyloterricola oryzae]|uniref:chemotaxis protein CheD n=1 Tax=Methyloterricola oryzae TaxID=1495050 RepID=UPI0005EBB9FA|nr:chemotaxis protein CheD [Methyloterricola oryzae]
MKSAPKPDDLVEIFLKPGEFHFGGPDKRIRTVLGSCVSLVFWHPDRHVGGMCHYLLPSRNGNAKSGELDGRYADEALELLLREIRRCGTLPGEYQVKLFGGGDMFPKSPKIPATQVGRRNVEAARDLIKRYNLNCVGEHLEGIGHRNVIFDVWSGHVWLKHQEPCDS